jgi:hypothetical protein
MPLRLRLAGPVILATILIAAPLAQAAPPSHLVAAATPVQENSVVGTFRVGDRDGLDDAALDGDRPVPASRLPPGPAARGPHDDGQVDLTVYPPRGRSPAKLPPCPMGRAAQRTA